MIGIVSENPEISDDKVTLSITAKEYLSDQINGSLLFNLYHFPEESHLLSISTKVSRGSSLYITGHLSLIEDLLLVKLTQVNFLESSSSLSYKSSNYAWEKKQTNEQPLSSVTNIAKSILSNVTKPKQKGKRKASTLTGINKIPKLASLSLSPPSSDINPQDETQPTSSEKKD